MKVIKSFILDTKNIKQNGESRRLSVLGGESAVFSLEVKSGSNYYNFQTNQFQTSRTRLSNVVISNGLFNVNVMFPPVSAGAEYDIYLTAEGDTMHADYKEVRFADGSMDINSTTGSNSRLVQKVIYQTLDVTTTISGYSPNGLITATNTTVPAISTSVGNTSNKIPFTLVVTAVPTNAFSINRQPQAEDIMAFITATVGANPIPIPGEDQYPVISTPVADVEGGGTRINGAVAGDSTTVTTHVVSSTIATVGDRVLGNSALAAATVTVTAVSSGTGKTFTISEHVDIADNTPLSFSNRRNYRWPISSTTQDLSRIIPGMSQLQGTVFSTQPIVSEYLDQITIFENEIGEYKVDKLRLPAVDLLGIKPVISRDADTKVVTTTYGSSSNPINVIFSNQALSIFSGANAKIFAYGTEEVERLTGYDVEFSDLAVVLSPVTTTTSSSTIGSSSTTVGVDSREGIVDNISIVSGIGIDPGAVSPTVSSGATGQSSSGNIVLSAAQELEDNASLTFTGASRVATITGYVKISDTSDKDVTLRFDLEKFLTMH
jgi:hypothetical protein